MWKFKWPRGREPWLFLVAGDFMYSGFSCRTEENFIRKWERECAGADRAYGQGKGGSG